MARSHAPYRARTRVMIEMTRPSNSLRSASAAAAMQPSSPWADWVQQSVDELAQAKLLRSLRPVLPTESPVEARQPPSLRPRPAAHASAPQVVVPHATFQAWLTDTASAGEEVPEEADTHAAPAGAAGHRVRLFSTNDYLGLSAHPAVRAAQAQAASRFGSGPRASALVAGYTGAHRRLERQLATLKGTEESLLFPTGFAANVSVLQALGGHADCALFSDALNHASIVDGCRLASRAGASVATYAHCDVAGCEALLAASSAKRKLVVTDTLFSMDGDWAPMRELAEVAKRHGALFVADDAHATLLGREGVKPDVVVGTLSKAVGSLGGFVACSAQLKLLLISRARGQVYSTALPLSCVAGASAALAASAADPSMQRRLWENVALFGTLTGLHCTSPIVPVPVGDEGAALRASGQLLSRGFHVPAIRPPTVPRGTARLRVALSAAHSEKDVRDLARALGEVGVLPPRARL